MTKFTKNKYLLTAFTIIAFGLTIVLGSLYAKDRIALNEVLNEADAVNFAYIDAGLLPKDVDFCETELKKEDGKYIYKINFESADTQYSYIISANNGEIISSLKEFTNSGVDTPREGTTAPAHTDAGQDVHDKPISTRSKHYISIGDAKSIALSHANLNSRDVTFEKAVLKKDDGNIIYIISLKQTQRRKIL